MSQYVYPHSQKLHTSKTNTFYVISYLSTSHTKIHTDYAPSKNNIPINPHHHRRRHRYPTDIKPKIRHLQSHRITMSCHNHHHHPHGPPPPCCAPPHHHRPPPPPMHHGCPPRCGCHRCRPPHHHGPPHFGPPHHHGPPHHCPPGPPPRW